MATKNYIDVTGLGHFKTKQDAYNLTKFASLSGGKVTAEQLPSYVDDVIEGYAVNNEGTVTFYSDAEHTQEITGETGKIYVDLAATVDGSYRYGGSQFVAIGNSVSTADKALKDASGNVITTTYATKAESTAPATTSTAGVVVIGDNLNVDSDGTVSVATAGTYSTPEQGEDDNNIYGVVSVGENITNASGVISLTAANVNGALGYTPLDEADLVAATSAQIDALFE